MFTRSRTIAAAAAALLLAVTGVAHANAFEDLARSLAGLRGEVEQLSTELSEQKGDLRDELRSLARQKFELSASLDREKIRLQKMRLSIAQHQKAVDEMEEKAQSLLPLFKHVAAAARVYIDGSLPFRREERLAEVTAVEAQLQAGLLTPQKAVARIWTVLEDEFRMGRESGLYRQTIHLDGKDQLADVLRVGMVTMYFKTGDDEVGVTVRAGDGFSYERLESPTDRKRVEAIFDSFKKQIRAGYFELPGMASLQVAK